MGGPGRPFLRHAAIGLKCFDETKPIMLAAALLLFHRQPPAAQRQLPDQNPSKPPRVLSGKSPSTLLRGIEASRPLPLVVRLLDISSRAVLGRLYLTDPLVAARAPGLCQRGERAVRSLHIEAISRHHHAILLSSGKLHRSDGLMRSTLCTNLCSPSFSRLAEPARCGVLVLRRTNWASRARHASPAP